MSTATLHPLAADYLKRLRRAGRRLPRARLRDLQAEIQGHLAEAIHPDSTDAEVLTVLDRLGEPEDIVAAELPEVIVAPQSRGTREWAAIFLLLFGGFFFFFGWVIGLILLWSSRAWTTLDKWIGTLIIPGGLGAVVFLVLVLAGTTTTGDCSGNASGGPMTCVNTGGGSHPLAIAGVIALVLAPFATAVYLAIRAR